MSESRRVVDLGKNPRKSASKEFKNWSDFIASSMQENFFSVFSIASSVQENFFSVFSIASSVQENFFSVFSIALSVQENFFSVFSIASSVQENFFSVFSIASSVKKTLPFKIVSLYSIFFSKIVYQYRLYIFEYRCPSLVGVYTIQGGSVARQKMISCYLYMYLYPYSPPPFC
jgi:hypothetical protein